MSKLIWDDIGNRKYHTGIDKGVFYKQTGKNFTDGEAWDGLISVTESPSGAEPTPLYANNRKYGELTSNEEFGFSIEAYEYPAGFGECNGEKEVAPGVKVTQQVRKAFGMTYRNLIGNDEEGTKHGYEIHLIYCAKAAPSEKAHTTINDSPEAETMSWECSTTPVEVAGCDPTAHLIINSTTVDADKLAAFEDIIYGSEEAEPRLPLPDEVATLLGGAAG